MASFLRARNLSFAAQAGPAARYRRAPAGMRGRHVGGRTAVAAQVEDGWEADGHGGVAVVLPERGIVERLLAHLMRTRRPDRDFERRTASAEAMIYWSMTLLMTRRLARSRHRRA
ncbi:hypothetical protein [Streptomyces bottropensis]|uniref:hypothetical protein n=1 Tax=Streptomyces bottropensis TaxID=42235 RepID=UPI0036B712D1